MKAMEMEEILTSEMIEITGGFADYDCNCQYGGAAQVVLRPNEL